MAPITGLNGDEKDPLGTPLLSRVMGQLRKFRDSHLIFPQQISVPPSTSVSELFTPISPTNNDQPPLNNATIC